MVISSMSLLSTIRGFLARGHSARADAAPTLWADHPGQRDIRARYDLAQTTDENSRHWANADNLSARAANNPFVRAVMRKRCRHEASNNPQLKGMVKKLSRDLVGTGPRLQLTTGHEAFDAFTTKHWRRWMKATRFVRKLRVNVLGRVNSGESFNHFTTNPKLKTPCKLDMRPFEADRCASPFENILDPRRVDGIDFDEFGNPAQYRVLNRHPGDMGPNQYDATWIPAEYVTHWFTEDREEQLRGVPETHPSMSLFSSGRRFMLATVSAAETAAMFGGVLESDIPAGGEAQPVDALAPVNLDRNTVMTLPEGWKLNQVDGKHPNDTFVAFRREIGKDTGQPLGMPVNIASGDSSDHNFASARLDGQTYWSEIDVGREDCELIIIEPCWHLWFAEFVLTETFLDWAASDAAHEDAGPENVELEDAVALVADGEGYTWEWDGHPHVDPQKERNASQTGIELGITSTESEAAAEGRSAAMEMAKEAKLLGMTVEQFQRGKRIQRFGFDPTDPKAVAPGTTPANGGRGQRDDPEDDLVPKKVRQRGAAVPAGGRA